MNGMSHGEVESTYAWVRLGVTLLLSTVGGVGMWAVVVALPAVQADFGVARADASLPYTLTMLAFGAAGIVMGRLSDRYGIMIPVALGAILLGAGYLLAAAAPSLTDYALAQGVLVGAGSSGCVVAARHNGLGRGCAWKADGAPSWSAGRCPSSSWGSSSRSRSRSRRRA